MLAICLVEWHIDQRWNNSSINVRKILYSFIMLSKTTRRKKCLTSRRVYAIEWFNCHGDAIFASIFHRCQSPYCAHARMPCIAAIKRKRALRLTYGGNQLRDNGNANNSNQRFVIANGELKKKNKQNRGEFHFQSHCKKVHSRNKNIATFEHIGRRLYQLYSFISIM